MKNEKLLSIVIASWNTMALTSECLKSIYGLEEFDETIEVIVIDNNSQDGTSEFIKSAFPSVNLICNDSNEGYAPACNQGIKVAKGKYILLLGSDTILKNGCLKACIDFLDRNNDCGAAGCRLVYPDGRLQGNCKKFPMLKNAFYIYLSIDKMNYDYDMHWFKYDKTTAVDQIATTFLMIKGELLKKLNGFDEKYRFLYNDVDLCRRIRKEGKEIYFIESAEIIHYGSYSTSKAPFNIRKKMYSDIFRYYWNYHGFPAMFLLPVLAFRLLAVTTFKR